MAYSQQWDQYRQSSINLLKRTSNVVTAIRNLAGIDELLNNDSLNQLDKLMESHNHLLRKLERDAFEVAIIGLEKAGKSTFANSLIAFAALPDATGRCTFTSTQLEAGHDEAEIFFYSRQDFDKLFRLMLQSVKYPHYETTSFEQLDPHDFREFFERLLYTHPDIYHLHKNKTERDILDILQGRSSISKYLGQPPLYIKGKDYISGGHHIYITDNARSRAVEKIIIRSENLNNMPNIVLYDVPGFDSPTKIHEKQTRDQLKSADAIILLTNVAVNPNLTGTQLNILKNESDSDGIRLAEKLFIFGNQIDRVNDPDIAPINIGILKNDALYEHHVVASVDRVIIGSAKAYLERNGILTIDEANRGKKEVTDSCLQALKVLNLPEGDGIDTMLARLESYHLTDRFDVLQKRINKQIESVRELFNEIISQNIDVSLSTDFRFYDIQTGADLLADASRKLETLLSSFADSVKLDITTNKYFSNKLIEDVENTLLSIDQTVINDVIPQIAISSELACDTLNINYRARQKVHSIFIEKFTSIVVTLAEEQAAVIRTRLIDTIAECIGISVENPYRKELLLEIEEYINKKTFDVSYDRRSFIHLLERFSRDVFELLLLYPLGTHDRYQRFMTSEEDFYSLAMYDDHRIVNQPFFVQPIVSMLLSHKPQLTNSTADFAKEFKDRLSDIPFLYSAMDAVSLEAITTRLKQKGLTPTSVFSMTVGGETLLLKLARVPMTSDQEIRVAILNTIDDFINNSIIEGSVLNKDAYFNELLKNSLPAITLPEVIDEINSDIDCLRDIIKRVVLKAIGLEKAFLSTITKQLEFLRDSKASPEFRELLCRNAIKIKHTEYSRIESQRLQFENRKKLIDMVEQLLSQIQDCSRMED